MSKDPEDYAFTNGGWKVPTMKYTERLVKRIEELEKEVQRFRDQRRKEALKETLDEMERSKDEMVESAKHMKAYDEELAQSPDIKSFKLWSGLVSGQQIPHKPESASDNQENEPQDLGDVLEHKHLDKRKSTVD